MPAPPGRRCYECQREPRDHMLTLLSAVV